MQQISVFIANQVLMSVFLKILFSSSLFFYRCKILITMVYLDLSWFFKLLLDFNEGVFMTFIRPFRNHLGTWIFKGQLISNRNFGVIKSPKKRTKLWRIFALVSKMDKIKKTETFHLFSTHTALQIYTTRLRWNSSHS